MPCKEDSELRAEGAGNNHLALRPLSTYALLELKYGDVTHHLTLLCRPLGASPFLGSQEDSRNTTVAVSLFLAPDLNTNTAGSQPDLSLLPLS